MTYRRPAYLLPLFFVLHFLQGTAISSPPPGRIVSLSPAMTETLYALRLGSRIVGVTNVCDRPGEARSKPKIGGMTKPSLEKIVALKPDMVVMDSDRNRRELVERLAGLGIRTYVFRATRLAELPAEFRKMGEVLGAKDASECLAIRIEAAIFRSVSQKAVQRTHRKRSVLFVIWPEPLITVGRNTMIDDAISLCGLTNINGDSNSPYPSMSLESVLARQPELIIFGGGGNQMNSTAGTANLLKRLGSLEAVRNKRICYTGDSLYRPGPRIGEGLAELRRCANIP